MLPRLAFALLLMVLHACGSDSGTKDASAERPCGALPELPTARDGTPLPICPAKNCSTCQGVRLAECEDACWAQGCWSCEKGQWRQIAVDCYPQQCWPDSGDGRGD